MYTLKSKRKRRNQRGWFLFYAAIAAKKQAVQ